MRKFLMLLPLAYCAVVAQGQPSAVWSDPFEEFETARIIFEEQAYGLAATRLADYTEYPLLSGTPRHEDRKLQAELLEALAAQRSGLPQANTLLERFIDRYSPQPIAIEAIRQVADLAFSERDYARASSFYKRLPLTGLSPSTRDEVRFRLGYTAFASKDFALASRYLGDLRAVPGNYREPATYYYGLTRYYTGDAAGARAAFESLASSEQYAGVVPGNLAQLYFADGDYERVINYTLPVLEQPEVRQRKQLFLLVGRSYFELGRFADALPYLEAAAEGGAKMSAADFYQLGYAQYVSGYFEPAAANLRQLEAEESALGQTAMYYLGNAYLKLDRPEDARPAFRRVIALDFNQTLRDEAAWNVAKLSYQLGYQQDALEALRAIPTTAPHYVEAQALLSKVILNSRDYAGALEVLDGIDQLSPSLRETRQQVLVLGGLQQLGARRIDEAFTQLSRSLEDASNAYYKALALYWLGDIAYRRGEMSTARTRLTSFLTTSAGLREPLPIEANPATAAYLLGYVHLRQNDYAAAQGHFQEAVVSLEGMQRQHPESLSLTQMHGDAVVRAGDASFKRNDYATAARFYESAVEQKLGDHVYALYQLAIIEGLRGDETEKIIALELIADEHPQSPYVAEALLELGVTYQNINQLNRAKQTLERLVSSHPKSPLRNEALLQLGLVSINQGNVETAINFYKQVFSNQPKAGEVRRAQEALQEIYVDDLGRPDDYFAFLATVPGFKLDASVRDSISFAAAKSLYQTGRYDQAIEQYTRYLQQFPKGGYALAAYWERADAHLIQESYPEALRDYESIIQQGEGAYYERSLDRAVRIAYNAANDYEKAYRYFARLTEVNESLSGDVELLQIGLQSAYRTRNEKALKQLAAEVLDNSKADPQLLAQAEFALGKLAYDAKRYDEALGYFNKVIRQSNTEQAAEARFLVARIYYLRREYELAETIALAAQQQSSAYPYWVAKSSMLLVDIFLQDEDYLSARAVSDALMSGYKGDEELTAAIAKQRTELERAAAQASRVVPEDSSSISLQAPESN